MSLPIKGRPKEEARHLHTKSQYEALSFIFDVSKLLKYVIMVPKLPLFMKEGLIVLSNKERSQLRAMGNSMSAIIMIGKGGITPSILNELDLALDARELVKARVLPNSDVVIKAAADQLAEATAAEIVQVVGRTILIYRQPPPGVVRKINF